MNVGDYMYRLTDYQTASWDGEFECFGSSWTEVRVILFVVVKVTPKGVWVEQAAVGNMWGQGVFPEFTNIAPPGAGLRSPKKFVLLNSRKQYACATPEEAVKSFRARKQRQLGILKEQVRRVEEALRRVSLFESCGVPPPPVVRGAQ